MYFLTAFAWLLIASEIAAPPEGDVRWWVTLRWITVAGWVVVIWIVSQRVATVIQ